jgi:hypothetical protein
MLFNVWEENIVSHATFDLKSKLPTKKVRNNVDVSVPNLFTIIFLISISINETKN